MVNASSEPLRLAINGMSYSGRDGSNANSAVIVSVTPEDYETDHPLAGIAFQRKLEEKAFEVGKGKIPVERYGMFRQAARAEGFYSGQAEAGISDIPESFAPCIKGAWDFAPMHEIFPSTLLTALAEGMEQFGKMIKGFDDARVFVTGVESRTSSPVRILRDDDLQSSLKGLYPCGEGAGYAGGITSAAMDGIYVAEKVAAHIIENEK